MVIDRPWDEAIVPEFPAERPVLPRAVAQPPNCPRRQYHLYRHQIVAYREASIALKICDGGALYPRILGKQLLAPFEQGPRSTALGGSDR